MANHHRMHTSLAISFALQLGFFIVASLVGFLLIGMWLDAYFETTPLFLFVGIACGLAETVYAVSHSLKPLLPPSSKPSSSHDSD